MDEENNKTSGSASLSALGGANLNQGNTTASTYRMPTVGPTTSAGLAKRLPVLAIEHDSEEVERPGEVSRHFDRLAESLEWLHNNIDRIEQKLTHVLVPTSTGNEKITEVPTPPASTTLGIALRSKTIVVDEATSRLKNIINRIDI